MSKAAKTPKMVDQEIRQLFAAIPESNQDEAFDRIELLFEENIGEASLERLRRLVINELVRLQTRH